MFDWLFVLTDDADIFAPKLVSILLGDQEKESIYGCLPVLICDLVKGDVRDIDLHWATHRQLFWHGVQEPVNDKILCDRQEGCGPFRFLIREYMLLAEGRHVDWRESFSGQETVNQQPWTLANFEEVRSIPDRMLIGGHGKYHGLKRGAFCMRPAGPGGQQSQGKLQWPV